MEQSQDMITNWRQEYLLSTVASPSSDDQVAVHLAALQSHSPIAQIHFTSHRKVLGRLVIIIKQGLQRLLTPILERQTAYNTTNSQLASYFGAQIEFLRQEYEGLTEQFQELERAVAHRWGEIIPQNVKTSHESGWDTYAEIWESSVKKPEMQHVGDEWGSSDLTDMIINKYVKSYLQADAIVLEIGCGGGKYSEKVASLCKLIICADVSQRMINMAKQRLQGFANINFEKLNGLDLHQFTSESINFVFSFDCFVHMEMEDIYCYLQEIRRVLVPKGIGLLHFANLNSESGWTKFVAEAPINRGNRKHFDRFCFLTWEIVEKFFHSLDLKILEYKREPWRDILVVFEK
jgi:ubiquinone/menaquinone biosynthesis C-methylase UbiE